SAITSSWAVGRPGGVARGGEGDAAWLGPGAGALAPDPRSAWVPASLLSPPDPWLTGGLPLGCGWPPAPVVRASLLSPPDPPASSAARASSRGPISSARTPS